MDAEMDYIEEHTAETFSDQLPSPGSPGRNGIYDEPLICPRIGDEYQVKIPKLATESQCFLLKSCLTSTGSMLAVDYHVGIGLEIPIMWVHHKSDATKDEQKKISCSNMSSVRCGLLEYTHAEKVQADAIYNTMSEFPAESSSYHCINFQRFTCKDECMDLANHCKEPNGSTSKERTVLENKMATGVPLLKFSEAKGYSPFPGTRSSYWSDNETQSFLLGLYIFGKNLVQVKKFTECKKMGDILSCYYGKFYRSDAYRRWSECRKIRSRRCILGHRIFTGWRQQEFLSRVLPKISKEVQDTLLEATNIFSEGRASLEEFVFTLKKTVGMQALVEAIGIGKGTHDLTGIILDPVRSNQSFSIRPEIPVGKACSSLTPEDIIKFLTGDFRLSKAKSNDLFWEAVWPRLLARGWHSEQPKNISYVASKHSLVFLIPGIKKFSRKRLVKGNHYFDSVSDVLNKVASDPSLLELEVEGAAGSNATKDENECAMDTKSDQNGLLDRQHHFYLRPRIPICNSEFMKFTIVDTSLVQGEGPFKVRELRTLPIDAVSNYGPLTDTPEIVSGNSEDSDDSLSDDQGDFDLDSSDKKKPKVTSKCIIGKAVHSSPTENVISFSSTTLPINGHISRDQCVDQLNKKLPVKDTKCQFSRRAKSGQQTYLVPMAKRRRLTACKNERTGRRAYSISKRYQLIEEGAQPKLGAQEASDNIVAEPGPFCGKIYPNFPIKSSPDEFGKCASKEECCGNVATFKATFSDGMPQSRTLIDLNLIPNIPTDNETSKHFNSDVAGSQHDLNLEEAVKLSETKQQHDGSGATENFTRVLDDQQPSVNSRRQSTRTQPPTTKALEAIACGFLGTKRRGRDTRALLSGNSTNRPSRRVHKTVEVTASAPPANINSSEFGLSNATIDNWYKGNTNHISTSNESSVQPDGNESNELLGVP